jgi:hypothetical protein
MQHSVVLWILDDVSEEFTTSIISVGQYLPDYNIPEDSHLHTRRRENLKFHTGVV